MTNGKWSGRDLAASAARIGAGGVGAGAGLAGVWKLFTVLPVGELLKNQSAFSLNVLFFISAVVLLTVYLTVPAVRLDETRKWLMTGVIAFLFVVSVTGFFAQIFWKPLFTIRIRFQPTMTDLARSASRNLQFQGYNAALSVDVVPDRGDTMPLDDGRPHEIPKLQAGDLLEVEIPHLEQYMTFSKAAVAANASCGNDLCTGTAKPTD